MMIFDSFFSIFFGKGSEVKDLRGVELELGEGIVIAGRS